MQVFLQTDASSLLQALRESGKQVNAIVTSPPYHLRRRYTKGDKRELGREKTEWEFAQSLASVFGAAKDASYLADDGSLMVNLGDSVVERQRRLSSLLFLVVMKYQYGWCVKDVIVWSKSNPVPNFPNEQLRSSVEYIFWLSKSPRCKFNQLKWTHPKSGNNIPLYNVWHETTQTDKNACQKMGHTASMNAQIPPFFCASAIT